MIYVIHEIAGELPYVYSHHISITQEIINMESNANILLFDVNKILWIACNSIHDGIKSVCFYNDCVISSSTYNTEQTILYQSSIKKYNLDRRLLKLNQILSE